jgi:hypothetical protein
VIPVREEKSVDVLRRYTLSLIDEVEKLQREVKRLSNIIDDSKQVAFPDIENKLTRLTIHAYSQGRERVEKPEINGRPIGHKDEVLLPHGERVSPEAKEDDGSLLPEEIVHHQMSEDALRLEAKSRGVEPADASVWEKVENLYQIANPHRSSAVGCVVFPTVRGGAAIVENSVNNSVDRVLIRC